MRKLKLDQLNRLDLSEYKKVAKFPIKIALDNIRSGHNVGSAFRTCDAFRINEIILAGLTPIPPHKEIFKTAIGSTESVAWQYVKSLPIRLAEFKKGNPNTKIIGIEQTDESIKLDEFKVDDSSDLILVFGNEVEGISDAVIPLLDGAIEVPQFGTKHSLNVSVCLGIVLWHFIQPYINYKIK